ncbi:hypothetical protein [Baekduia sp.]|jgi:hypothetical protein|uniref:hypothetical protein n=1 Tax=Baekduia sp. TaxID=2600305 RepID=UPI002DFDBA5D|nr:hypothetical protein [Baekduia sp.]
MNTTSIVWLLVALLVFGPTLVCLLSRLVPLVLVAAVVIGALRVIWAWTDRW